MRWILGVVVAAALLVMPGKAAADHMMCGVPAKQTRAVYIEPSAWNYGFMVGPAVDYWNEASGYIAGRPLFKWWTNEPAPNLVVRKDSYNTWVEYDCNGGAILHIGNETIEYLWTWIAHELGHTVGFGDHIRTTTNPAGYTNPKIYDGTYNGAMSYVGDHSTITWDDLNMLWRWWFW